mmetsp:Transcript_6571/g.9640  ORF Transcript_6571/g.9640 Transcript_6571/m.9640 type:complete len:236 (-) Transcript_6571:1220-1927(-)
MKPLLSLFTALQSCRPSIPSTTTRTLTTMSESSKALVVDPFCFRQFESEESSKSYGGTVFSTSIHEFESIVNTHYDEKKLQDGYAPFCKHLFIENFTDGQVNVLEITPENEHCLRTKYEARNDKELPVLTRFFPKELVVSDDKPLPVAKYLDLILYSRDQINKENDAMEKETGEETAPWGIVSIKAQDVDFEIPMTPITSMRNALGKDQGGSGVTLDRDSYMEAYEYWNNHANIS